MPSSLAPSSLPAAAAAAHGTRNPQFTAVVKKTAEEELWGAYFPEPEGPDAIGVGNWYKEARVSLPALMYYMLDCAGHPPGEPLSSPA